MRHFIRYIIVAALLTIASVTTNHCVAQDKLVRTEMGVSAGAVYTGLGSVTTDAVTLNPRFGFYGEFDFALRIGRNFAIECEVAYGGGSVVAATPYVERKIRTSTVDIPLLLSLRLWDNRIRISAGPQFTVMSKAEYTLNDEKHYFGPLHPTWNIAGGIGVGISKHFIIKARFVYGLKDALNQFEGVEFTTRAYRITAGVALIF
jgi:hypothetical protein